MPLSSAVVVRHHCDVPACCNPRHLAPGTPAKNVADRVERGRSATGQANGRAVLTEAQVLAIYHSARPASTLSAECGVSRFTVYDIRSGRIWVHLTGHSSHGNVPLREFVGI